MANKVIANIKTGAQITKIEAQQKITNNRANILTGASVLGTIATAVVSWLEGMKSQRDIDKKAAEVQRELTIKEKAQVCWKNAVAPVALVVGTNASAITSNRIQAQDIARLTTDVTLAQKAFSEFKKASDEVLTEKQQQEVKDKMAEKEFQKMTPEKIDHIPDNGGPGVAQIFKDNWSGIVFTSTRDKVELATSKIREMMAELIPRNRYGYSPMVLGVRYKEWLSFVGAYDGDLYNKETVLYEKYGWNKGFHDNGEDDDDVISYYLAPGEVMYRGEPRSAYIIYWDQDPSDMELGNYLKSSGV